MKLTKKQLLDMLKDIPDNTEILIDNPYNDDRYETISLHVNKNDLEKYNQIILTVE